MFPDRLKLGYWFFAALVAQDFCIAQEGITADKVVPNFEVLGKGIRSEFAQISLETSNADYVAGTPLTNYSKSFPIQFTVILTLPGMTDPQEAIQLTIDYFDNPKTTDEHFVQRRDSYANHKVESLRRPPLLLEENQIWRQHLWETDGRIAIPDEYFFGHVSNVNFELYYRAKQIDRKRLVEMGENYRDYLLGLLGQDPSLGDAKEVRTWTNLSGKTIEASLVNFNAKAGTITLRRKDGQEFKELPVSGFSDADKNYLETQKGGQTLKANP